MGMYTACPDVLQKNLELVYMIFFLYTSGVQYLILTRFHVKQKKHVLYKKNTFYIRKTLFLYKKSNNKQR